MGHISFRDIFQKFSGLNLFYRLYENIKSRFLKTEKIFTDIYHENRWGGRESVSGVGSDLDQTRFIIELLPKLFSDLEIKTLLDIPCGDFFWMNKINLDGIDYIGGDIVKKIIKENRKKYGNINKKFIRMNLITDKIPKVDLILCRDCLVHFSFEDIYHSLHNICNSKSNYLLTTTFPACKYNKEIQTGHWRILNFTIEPFNFPKPLKTIWEGCTLQNYVYIDKSLGLWKIEDIEKIIFNN